MITNYYLSHNTNMYIDWLEEYEDTDLLQLWLKEQMYCCFLLSPFSKLSSIYDINGRGDGEEHGYFSGNGEDIIYEYVYQFDDEGNDLYDGLAEPFRYGSGGDDLDIEYHIFGNGYQ